MAYRVINFIVILIRPDVSAVLVDLVAGVDTAMICNMGFYIGKSGFENVAKIIAGRKVTVEEDETDDKDDSEGSTNEDQLEG